MNHSCTRFRLPRRWVVIAFLCSALLPTAGASQEPRTSSGSPTPLYVLLSGSEAEIAILRSRLGPKVAGGWKANGEIVAALESNLKNITSLRSGGGVKGIRIEHPEKYYRQYVPVVVAGRKLIYVNAFCRSEVPDWRTHFVTILDGGDCVWSVLYDPATGQFSDLEVNGDA